jgi:hypothetical protein
MNDARSDIHLSFENNPSPEVRSILSKKIDEFNSRTVPFEHERFAFLLHDAADCQWVACPAFSTGTGYSLTASGLITCAEERDLDAK